MSFENFRLVAFKAGSEKRHLAAWAATGRSGQVEQQHLGMAKAFEVNLADALQRRTVTAAEGRAVDGNVAARDMQVALGA